jgi:hypothetical protein
VVGLRHLRGSERDDRRDLLRGWAGHADTDGDDSGDHNAWCDDRDDRDDRDNGADYSSDDSAGHDHPAGNDARGHDTHTHVRSQTMSRRRSNPVPWWAGPAAVFGVLAGGGALIAVVAYAKSSGANSAASSATVAPTTAPAATTPAYSASNIYTSAPTTPTATGATTPPVTTTPPPNMTVTPTPT